MADDHKKKEDPENKKKNVVVTAVLKTDLHCDGCASKLLKLIRSIDGVDTASAGDGQKITVVGNVDPAKLREKVERKTHKKVELLSPLPKKDDKKPDSNHKSSSPNEKQEEEAVPITTAVFKVTLHCDGCIHKIYKSVTKTKGYEDMKIDKPKDLVTVTGAMDMKALAEVLSKHLKRDVQIVPPKKDAAAAAGEKKEKETGKNSGAGADEKKEGNSAMQPFSYPYPSSAIGEQMHYNPYPVFPNHAPQIFSDENPNACSVM